MITYLLYILPFRKFIDPEYIDNGYLFPDSKSKYGHWDTARQTRIMVRETKSRLGFAMRTSDWRQIQVALDREFIHTNYEHIVEEDEYEDDIHDLQAVHSTKVAKLKYGNTGTRVDATTSSMFQYVSGKFHAWYYLVSRPPRDDFIESQQLSTRIIPSQDDIQRALNRLYGNGAEFRSAKHREAMDCILQGNSPVITIFPTGSGKTGFILLPVILYPEKTFIVITPLVELANEFQKRCQDLQLSCHRWTKRIIGRSNIIVVVIDTAIVADFYIFLRNIQLNGDLGAIYLDEIHTISEDQHYRPAMNEVFRLSLGVQYIGMTATFPPSMKDRLEYAMCFNNINPHYIRAPTYKPRMKYSVKTVPDGSLEKESVAFISSESERFKKDGSKRKIMVFCPKKSLCDSLAADLGCAKYYSDYCDKYKDLKAWKEGQMNIIICTGALGAGMDFDNVVLVIHVDKPYGCMAFAQESGRAGRKGEDAESVIFMEESTIRKLKVMGYMMDADVAMRDYIINAECRRIALNKFLDGDESGADCRGLNCRLCDNCQGREVSRKRILPSEFEQDLQYRKRVDLVKKRQMEDESVRIYMKTTIDKLQSENMCIYCFFHIGAGNHMHSSKECGFMNFSWFPGELKQRLEYKMQNIVCYRCSVPCDWCDVQGKKATNAFGLFEKICRRRMKFT